MNVRLPRDGMPSVRGKTLIVVVSVVAFVAMNVATRINQSFEEQKIEIEKLKRELKNASIKYQELHKKLDEASSQPSQQAELTADKCRDVFSTKGQGGMGELTELRFNNYCEGDMSYNACDDLRAFTGLAEDEFGNRAQRKGRFHFEAEHTFWNPQTSTELAWYYSTSVDYLFANVIHEAKASVLDELIKRKLEPVLDYSGGVGNNIMHLAKKGIRCHYFGIGMIEYAFAEFRVAKNNLTDLVEFKKPYSPKTGYRFDSITSALPGDGSLGAILAMDVLEHIPKYHLVVKEMVDSLLVGGVIAEKSPFDNRGQNGEDVRIHVSNGGVSMEDAMGPRMKQEEKYGNVRFWVKVKE